MLVYSTEGRQVVDFGPGNTGLLPTFSVYKDLDTLEDLIQPVVYEIDGGSYYFDVNFPLSDSPTTSSVVLKVTAGGVSQSLVVTPQPVNTNSGELREAFDLGDDAAGIDPQFVYYRDQATQLEITPQPVISEIGGGLYYFPYQFPIESSPTTEIIDFMVTAPLANPLSLTPDSGSTAGGTSVTITGTDFLPGATVTFGGDAAVVGVITSTTISVTTPAHDEGTVDVVVTNPGTAAATLPDAFSYESAPAVDWKALVQRLGAIGVVVGTDAAALTTTGTSFTTTNSMPPGSWRAVASNSAGGIIMAISDDGKCVTTETDGGHWTSQGLLPEGHWRGLTFAANIGVGTWVACGSGVGTASPFTSLIATSTDNGQNWTQETPPADGYEYNAAETNFPTSDILILVGSKISDGSGAIARSTNATAWTDLSSGIAHPLAAVVYASGGTARWTAFGANGSTSGVYYNTTSAGTVWSLTGTLAGLSPTGAGYISGVGSINVTGTALDGNATTVAFKSTDNGQTFSAKTLPSGKYRCAVGIVTVDVYVTAGDAGVISYSIDGGDTWAAASTSPPGPGYWTYATSVPSTFETFSAGGCFHTGQTFFACGSDDVGNGMIIRTTNGGQTWSDITPSGLTGSVRVQSIASDGTNILAVVYDFNISAGRLIRSTDGGGTWSNISMPSIPSSGTWSNLQEIAYNGSVWFSVFGSALDGLNYYMTSTDSVNFTTHAYTLGGVDVVGVWQGVSNGRFVNIYESPDPSRRTFNSPDGTTWNENDSVIVADAQVANNQFMIDGNSTIIMVVGTDAAGTQGVNFTTSNFGALWAAGTIPTNDAWRLVGWDGVRWIAMGNGNGRTVTSPDANGATWSEVDISGDFVQVLISDRAGRAVVLGTDVGGTNIAKYHT